VDYFADNFPDIFFVRNGEVCGVLILVEHISSIVSLIVEFDYFISNILFSMSERRLFNELILETLFHISSTLLSFDNSSCFIILTSMYPAIKTTNNECIHSLRENSRSFSLKASTPTITPKQGIQSSYEYDNSSCLFVVDKIEGLSHASSLIEIITHIVWGIIAYEAYLHVLIFIYP
jgi:hypothetical protein